MKKTTINRISTELNDLINELRNAKGSDNYYLSKGCIKAAKEFAQKNKDFFSFNITKKRYWEIKFREDIWKQNKDLINWCSENASEIKYIIRDTQFYKQIQSKYLKDLENKYKSAFSGDKFKEKYGEDFEIEYIGYKETYSSMVEFKISIGDFTSKKLEAKHSDILSVMKVINPAIIEYKIKDIEKVISNLEERLIKRKQELIDVSKDFKIRKKLSETINYKNVII